MPLSPPIPLWPRCARVPGFLAALALTVWSSPAGAQEPREAAYVIGNGDVLQIFVWKEPELTRDVAVRLDGKITVPLLGDVQASGRTPQQLAGDLEKSLARFLSAPKVTLGVAQTSSRRFYVIGKVGKPGDYALTARTTVLQGLALAGGPTEFAKVDGILIVRQDEKGETAIPFNYKRLLDGRDLSQNVVLRPGDTILVP